ncbi:MAG: hypothetical protein AAFP19_22085, partial [Bacteroidota bacterium]
MINLKKTIVLILAFLGIFSHNLLAQCGFTITSTPSCGETVVDFSVDSPSGTYAWDFDNDTNVDAFGTNVSYIYPAAGIDIFYTVALYRNGVPCPTQTVQILAIPDGSIGVVPGSGNMDGNQIRVCSAIPEATLSIFNSSMSYATDSLYEIDWGDGTIENLTRAEFSNITFRSHDYNGYGFYTLTVRVTSTNGCVNVQTYDFYNGGNPSVGLEIPGNTVGLCAPATVDFPVSNTANNPAGTMYNLYIGGVLIASYDQTN